MSGQATDVVPHPGTDAVWRDPSRLVIVVSVLLILGAVLDLVSIGSSWLQLNLLRGEFTALEAEANDAREGLIGGLTVAVYLASVITFAMWVYRSHRNVRARGAAGLIDSPAWAVCRH